MNRVASPVVGRFAPSPTGELHLGNVRTALVAWLAVRSVGGRLIMRLEDLDPPRVLPGAAARIAEDLRWLGLDWDEGAEQGGTTGPYWQSDRTAHYVNALRHLHATGRLYGCTCSRADLRRLSSAPHGGADEGPVYPGLCRERNRPVLFDTAPGGRLSALRFRVVPGLTAFEDLLAGSASQDVALQVGDFVVRRADALFAYQLAVVVDDALMGVNQVVRGADLLDSTPRQIQLIEALGHTPPSYAHVPLVVDAAGQRLAKRDQATGVRGLREAGVPAERVIGLLAWSLGLTENLTPVTPSELIDAFAWDKIPGEAWSFDPACDLFLRRTDFR